MLKLQDGTKKKERLTVPAIFPLYNLENNSAETHKKKNGQRDSEAQAVISSVDSNGLSDEGNNHTQTTGEKH